MTMKKLLMCSMLAAAFTLVAAELKQPAFRMTEAELLAVLRENDLNDQVTACQELCHTGTAACVPALAALLTDAAPRELFHAARYGLQNIPGPEAEAALKAALATVKDAKRCGGLEASLRLRATPVAPEYAAASAALTAFPPKTPLQNGDLSVVPALVETALGGGFPAQLARRQLVGFPNEGVVQKMLDLVAGGDVKKAKLAISVLGDRRVRSCLPQFCEIARTTPQAGIRTEIFKSFATLCDAGDLPMLLGLLKEMPKESRLEGSIIRLATRELVADKVDVVILKADYGYFGPDEVKDAHGKVVRPVANVMDMVTELVKNGSRSIMASNRLAGHGGFAHDPAPGREKELHLTYRIGDGPERSTITRENGEAELAGCRLPEAVARPLVDACAAAQGDFRAALERILGTLEKRGRIPGADAVLFRPIFNGKDLAGWSQVDDYFSVQDGIITGSSTQSHLCKPNHHLVYTAEELTDFELRAEFKLSRSANSGIQIRCAPQFVGDNGYQADMNGGGNYVGYLYHPRQHLVGERGADVAIDAAGQKKVTRFADGKELQKLYKVEQWNDIRIVVRGCTINVYVNGVRTTSIEDPRADFLPAKGHIALQLHQGPEMTVQFRNLRLRR
ncbi:MAG: family 16 glycoside hydrolase [Kiritimatiellia bacterium]